MREAGGGGGDGGTELARLGGVADGGAGVAGRKSRMENHPASVVCRGYPLGAVRRHQRSQLSFGMSVADAQRN